MEVLIQLADAGTMALALLDGYQPDRLQRLQLGGRLQLAQPADGGHLKVHPHVMGRPKRLEAKGRDRPAAGVNHPDEAFALRGLKPSADRRPAGEILPAIPVSVVTFPGYLGK